jgi:hypothetical protein
MSDLLFGFFWFCIVILFISMDADNIPRKVDRIKPIE